MKRNIAIALIIILLLQIILPIKTSIAQSDNVLITTSGISITNTTKPAEITSKYGTGPKLVTPSAFGGNMYTWYTGDYENVIYLETDEVGNVIAAGAISDDFKSSLYSAGEKVESSGKRFQGTVAGTIAKGAIVYQQELLTDERLDAYYREYVSSKFKYDKYVAQQTTIMLNALLREDGSKLRAEFDSEVYDKADRITEIMTLSTYAEKNNKEQYYKYAGIDLGSTLWSDFPNPLRAAKTAYRFYPTEEIKYAYCIYGIYQDKKTGKYSGGVTQAYISDKLFEKTNEIELTNEEQEKLKKATDLYLESVETFNKNGEDYFEQEPTYKTLPLVAGKIKENKLQGSTGFLNAIRAGAGLGTVTYNSAMSNAAQHKAVLTSYITSKGISNPNPHYPPHPSGVSDEFYNTAQSYMTGENLYGGDIITSISKALNDAAGDPIGAGHRYNLLEPRWTNFGIGYSTDGQSAHKFSGNASITVDAVAWPSIGITPTEAWVSGGYWTFKLYNKTKYSITIDTVVEVKRLNDNKTWTFNDKSSSTSNGASRFVRGGDMISFYNADLTAGDGIVYEITIKNLKNNNSNANEDYKYRAVFKSLYEGTNIVYPSQVILDQTNIKAVPETEIVLNVDFAPDNVTEIATKWSSSNAQVATVNQYGLVTVKGTGTTTITVETLNGKKAYCTINGVSAITSLQFEKSQYIIREGKTEKLILSEKNNILINPNLIKWTISDSSKAKITKGNITALSNSGGSTLTVTAEYGGKKATCTILILKSYNSSPIFRLSEFITTKISKGETQKVRFAQSAENTYIVKFDADITYDAKNLEVTNLETLVDNIQAKVTTPGTIHVSFDSNNKIVDINKDLLYITFKSNSMVAATYKILADDIKYYTYESDTEKTTDAFYKASIYTYNEIQSITLSKNSYTFENIGDYFRLQATLNPNTDIRNSEIKWSTDNKNVATIDSAGFVTARGYGTATITAESINGKKASCVITVKEPPKQYTLGDVNNDGKINTVDVIMILQHISHKITLTDTQILAANTYKDSKENLINTLDAIKILQYISHKITEF